MLSQQADQRGDGGVVLAGFMGVLALLIQVALLVVSWEDAGQDVDAVGLVVKGRLSGEDQEVCAVLTPSDLLLQEENGGRRKASRQRTWRWTRPDRSSIWEYFVGSYSSSRRRAEKKSAA